MKRNLFILFFIILIIITFSCKPTDDAGDSGDGGDAGNGITLNLTINPSDTDNQVYVYPLQPQDGYEAGTEVTLIPVPDETQDPWYAFDNWSGEDSGDILDNSDGTYTITMDESKTIIAEFYERTNVSINITIEPQQAEDELAYVKIEPELDNYYEGMDITLTPIKGITYEFDQWEDSSTTVPREVTLGDTNLDVTATYTLLSYSRYDDFEAGTIPTDAYSMAYFQQYWDSGSDPVISTTESYTGTNSVQFTGTDYYGVQKSFMVADVDVTTDSFIAFSYKVSGSEDFNAFDERDHFGFYVDDTTTPVVYEFGESEWKRYTYQIPAGTHELCWGFFERVPSTGGQNSSWVDDIVFGPDINIIAPEGEVIIDYLGNEVDTTQVNNLGYVSPGDTMMTFTMTNLGKADETITSISLGGSSSPEFSLTNNPADPDPVIIPNDGTEVTFEITLTGAVEPNQYTAYVDIATDTTKDYNFSFNVDCIAPVTEINEDFETGDLSSYNWNYGGQANPQVIDDTEVPELVRRGTYSLQFGEREPIAGEDNVPPYHDGMSFIEIDVEVQTAPKTLTYWFKTSAHLADKLSLYIDGNSIYSKGGPSKPWARYAHTFDTTGTYKVRWEYSKNTYTNFYYDSAWIDDIKLGDPESQIAIKYGDDFIYDGETYYVTVDNTGGSTVNVDIEMVNIGTSDLYLTGTVPDYVVLSNNDPELTVIQPSGTIIGAVTGTDPFNSETFTISVDTTDGTNTTYTGDISIDNNSSVTPFTFNIEVLSTKPELIDDFESHSSGQAPPAPWVVGVNSTYSGTPNGPVVYYDTYDYIKYLRLLRDQLGAPGSYGEVETGYTYAQYSYTAADAGYIAFDYVQNDLKNGELLEFWLDLDIADIDIPTSPADWSMQTPLVEDIITVKVPIPSAGTYRLTWKASKSVGGENDEDVVGIDNLRFLP